jgi:hypothetical protein
MPFYLSHPDDRQAILANGISANSDGYIDIFTDNMIGNAIAKDQLFLDRYTLFWITPTGITAEAEPYDVGVLTAKYQFRIRQSRVDERFVRLMGEYDVIKDRPTTWDYLFWGRMGFRKTDVDEQFQILASIEAGKLTPEQANAKLAKLSERVNLPLTKRRRGKKASSRKAKDESEVRSAFRSASAKLEKALSAVKNLREYAKERKRAFKLKRKKPGNPYPDLSK